MLSVTDGGLASDAPWGWTLLAHLFSGDLVRGRPRRLRLAFDQQKRTTSPKAWVRYVRAEFAAQDERERALGQSGRASGEHAVASVVGATVAHGFMHKFHLCSRSTELDGRICCLFETEVSGIPP